MAKSRNNKTFWENIMNCVAYIAVVAIGLAIMVAWILSSTNNSGKFAGALMTIAEVLAYTVVAFYSLFFVLKQPKRSMLIGLLCAWVAAIVLIVVFRVL